MKGSRYSLEVRPRIPQSLARLPELAANLVYSWDRDLRRLFRYLDTDLYEACAGNLKLFLRRVAQARIDQAAQDPTFLRSYSQVLSAYDSFHAREMPQDLQALLDPAEDLIAYFCFEFGFHESLPIYSGGLGILAGDHCKAAADLAVPLVAVGLMYHQGYFDQRLDSTGQQHERYQSSDLDTLPLVLVTDDDGREIRVEVALGAAAVELRLWRGHIGPVAIYLLDSEVDGNPPELRAVTHRLYGGGEVNRIRQEIVLGIGGVRALRALGLNPTVWHLNEGHPAFQALERCRELHADGTALATALEVVAANTVFTTHTPVPAGHDAFHWDLVEAELGAYLATLGMSLRELFDIGQNGDPQRLNMTALAMRTSRFRNGVSRVHGRVASGTSTYIWPEIPADENPVGHVTNGVHLQTFLALEWVNLFDVRFASWRSNLADPDYWRCIDDLSDHQFRSLRLELKAQLLMGIRQRLLAQHRRNGIAETTIDRILELIDNPQRDVLILGFARRFATYKRATLIFSDPDRLARLLGDPARPVLLLMAGKAHPEDNPGKELIREIYRLSMDPRFLGKVHLIENYDLSLGRLLASGVDVWLNTPEYPMEASGTSGMKAAINGVVNLSVLDGWWAEGFDGDNGWAIHPHDQHWDPDYRYRQESEELLELLEHQVIPLYFDRRDGDGWPAMAKAAMRTCIPRFNSQRMLREYVTDLYAPAKRLSRELASPGHVQAESLVAWKRRVREAWDHIQAQVTAPPPAQVPEGEAVSIEVRVELSGLEAEHVRVECLVESEPAPEDGAGRVVYALSPVDEGWSGEIVRYRLEFKPPFSGLQHFRIRLYPVHPLLGHRFEMGRLIWL
jgi:glycogen phosphorylase